MLPQYAATKSVGKYALYLININTSNDVPVTKNLPSTFDELEYILTTLWPYAQRRKTLT
jgi:hypothetical protein